MGGLKRNRIFKSKGIKGWGLLTFLGGSIVPQSQREIKREVQVDQNFQGRLTPRLTHTNTRLPLAPTPSQPRVLSPLYMVAIATQHPTSTPTTPGANSQDITPYFVRIGELKGCTPYACVGPFNRSSREIPF
ncbi:unnamed protein product [Pieris macdunnoughi]|uniref:Uncharacterized protein n=1 Tax=Pieris macdunnoughi TaxID=345717 RepID=A0A821WE46_9NEOP|nr:unnamed protein product [Pieris macdunnoughi]